MSLDHRGRGKAKGRGRRAAPLHGAGHGMVASGELRNAGPGPIPLTSQRTTDSLRARASAPQTARAAVDSPRNADPRKVPAGPARAVLAPPLSARSPVIGMVHLSPLPGSPGFGGRLETVLERAAADARALQAGGVDALMFENFGDAPFFPEHVPAETIAAITRVIADLVPVLRVPFGVNVLRNDARAALGIAAATGAAFVRINVHVGAAVTDQGPIVGRAHETLRERARLCPGVRLWCDCRVKHSAPLAPRPLGEEIEDLVERGLADAVILTGPATGKPASIADLAEARQAHPGTPFLVGSGAARGNLRELFPLADGFIVGTTFKTRGRVDAARVRAFVQDVRMLRGRAR